MFVAPPLAAQTYTEAPDAGRTGRRRSSARAGGTAAGDPEVITPYESVGRYGGEINFGLSGSGDQDSVSDWSGDLGLLRYDRDSGYATVLPNLASSWEISEPRPSPPTCGAGCAGRMARL